MTTKITRSNIASTGVAAGSYSAADITVNSSGQVTSASTSSIAASGGGGPKISSVAVTDNSWNVLDDTAVDVLGGYIKITGSGFSSGCLVYFNQTPATSVSFVSGSELRVTTGAFLAGTYVLYAINTDGGVAISVPGVTFSATPAWQTASSLSEQYDGVAITLSLIAQDATSYTLVSGSLPPGLSLNTNTGTITGTVTGVTVDTTYTFTVRATDAQNQDSPRTFTVTITVSDPYFNRTTLLLSGSALSTNTVIRDSSTNNFNLTAFGDARASNFSPYGTGWSNYFDGSGDYLSLANNTAFDLSSGDFTVEAWVYRTGDSGAYQEWIIGKRSISAGDSYLWSWSLGIGSSNYAVFGNYNGSITGTTAINLNTWYHIAVTRISGAYKLYVNGLLESTNAGFAIPEVNVSLTIGNYTVDNPTFTGYISNIRVIKGNGLYTANFTPATTNLTSVANTSLLTCNANRFLDGSTNNFAITGNGDAKVVSFNPFGITNTGVNGSAYFDGSGDYLQIPTNTAFNLGTGAFCVEFWVYITSLAEQPSFINNNNTNIFYETSGSNRGLCLYASAAAQLTSSTTALPLNAWNHVVICRNTTGTLSSFVNGTRLATAASNTSTVDFSNAIINRYFPSAAGHLFGYTSDLRMVKGSTPYDPTLTTCTVPTAPLTAITNTQLLTLQYDQPHNNHTFLDSSSNQFLITRNGNTTQGTFSPFSQTGWGNYFDGSGDWLNYTNTDNFGTSAFTVQAWVWFSATATNDSAFIDGRPTGGSSTGYLMAVRNSSKVLRFASAAAYDGVTPLVANTWNHVAATYTGGTLRLYLNGNLDATFTGLSFNFTDTNFVIGKAHFASGEWTGYISNLQLIKGTALYTSSTYTVPTSPLTAISGTSLLTCQSNRFIDASTNNFTITRNGDTRVVAFSPFAPAAVYSPVTHGASAYFDRTGDFLSLATNNSFDFGTGNFTVELFYYPLAYDDIQMFFSGTSNYQFGYSASDSRNLYYYGSSGNTISGTPAASMLLNQWNHIVLVRSGASLAIMSNGVRQGTATHSSSVNFSGSPTIGGYADSTTSYAIRGYMAGFRVVKGIAIYDPTQTTYTVPTTPPTATTNTSLLLNFTDAAILDSTGRNVIETVADAKTSSVQVKYGTGAMYFDGTGDVAIVPNSSLFTLGASNFTIESWVYVTQQTTNQYYSIFGKRPSTSNQSYISLSVRNNVAVFHFANSSTGGWSSLTNGNINIALNTWTHMALSRNGSAFNVYINGVRDTGASITSSAAVVDNSTPFYVGTGTADAGGEFFVGYLDDFRFTNGYARYTSNFTPPIGPHRLK